MTDTDRVDPERPDPDELLARLQREEEAARTGRGRLRIYLGMAPGVGKTFAMLHEGRRRQARGTDVVIGFVETYGRPLTVQALEGLEVIPRKKVVYRGVALEEMDTDAVIARRPAVALVDELAHTNAPGSPREKRWQDVEAIRAAGITVISTLNVQHLESLNELVENITGVRTRETVPDSIVDQADEIELVDMSPEALRSRMRHGNVYPPAQAEAALAHFFTVENLAALRRLALMRTAQEVEQQVEEYMRDLRRPGLQVEERVLVVVDEQPHSKAVLRRGWRIASGMRGELLAVWVDTGADLAPHARANIETHLRLAEDLNAQVHRVEAKERAAGIAEVARAALVTQVVVGRSPVSRWQLLRGGTLVDRLLALLPHVDLHVIADRG
jgi:two-component system, OmpR family, sensor histidine kinase KdpD